MYANHSYRTLAVLGALAVAALSGCGRENQITGPGLPSGGTSVQMSRKAEPIPVSQIQTDYVGEWTNENAGEALASIEIKTSSAAASMHPFGPDLDWGTRDATRIGADLVATFEDAKGNGHRLDAQYANAAGSEIQVMDVAPTAGGVSTHMFRAPSPFVGQWVNDDRRVWLRGLEAALVNRGQALSVATDYGVATTLLSSGEIIMILSDGANQHRLSFTLSGSKVRLVDVVFGSGQVAKTYYFSKVAAS